MIRCPPNRGNSSQPGKMLVSEWLRPVYEGISEILVGSPIKLASFQDAVASGNCDTTGVLRHDVCVDAVDCCPFAAVAKVGLGHAIFIAGDISGDVWLERCPDNIRWLTNLAAFLVEESSREARRRQSRVTSPHTLFLSHRSVNKPFVRRVADQLRRHKIHEWLDEREMIPSDSLPEEIELGLGKMTHFVLFWSKDCTNSQWVRWELDDAVRKSKVNNLPILVVRLDDTPVPPVIDHLLRIEANEPEPEEVGAKLAETVDRLAKRSASTTPATNG